MDKKSIVGFALIGLILVGFSMYSSKQDSHTKELKQKQDSIAYVNALEEAALVAKQEQDTVIDTKKAIVKENDTSFVAAHAVTIDTQYLLQNNKIAISINNKGACPASVRLLDYKKHNGDPLYLFKGNQNKFDLKFFTNRMISTQDFRFTSISGIVKLQDGSQQLSLKLYFSATAYVEYLYKLPKDEYMVDLKVNMVGMNQHIAPNMTNIEMAWLVDAPQQEKGFDNENNYTTIAYRFPGDDVEELGVSKEEESEEVKTKVKWLAFKQQFFSSILVAQEQNTLSDLKMKYNTYTPNNPDGMIKKFEMTGLLAYQSKDLVSLPFSFYFGPNKYSILDNYDQKFEKLVPMGGWLIGWINKYIVVTLFDFLSKYIGNLGLIILILTIIIKVTLSPLTIRSYKSSAMMRVIKPEVDKLGERYPKKEDAMKKQQEVMALYKKAGINPMGGCIPMLLQMPFLFAMFRFFPAAIELRQESFLWADDLSSFDSILQLPFNIPFYGDHISLFTLLMAVSMYFTSKLSMGQIDNTQMPGMKFMSLYLMPVMLLVWFNNYASGLTYYYFLSNIFTLAQTLGIRKFIDEDKIHRMIKENAKKPVKKSRFQQKLDEMMRTQQQQVRKK